MTDRTHNNDSSSGSDSGAQLNSPECLGSAEMNDKMVESFSETQQQRQQNNNGGEDVIEVITAEGTSKQQPNQSDGSNNNDSNDSADESTGNKTDRLRPAARAIVLLRRAATTLLPATTTSQADTLRKSQSKWRRYQWHKLHYSTEAGSVLSQDKNTDSNNNNKVSTDQQRHSPSSSSPSVSMVGRQQPAQQLPQQPQQQQLIGSNFLVPKSNALKLPIVCLIKSIDGSPLCEIYVHRFELGQYLIDNLKVSLGLRDCRWFGLKLANDINEQDDPLRPWLDLNERVIKQIEKHSRSSFATATTKTSEGSARRLSTISTGSSFAGAKTGSSSTCPSTSPSNPFSYESTLTKQRQNSNNGQVHNFRGCKRWLLKRRLLRTQHQSEDLDPNHIISKSASLDTIADLDGQQIALSPDKDKDSYAQQQPQPQQQAASNESCRCVQMFLRIKYYPPEVPRSQDSFLRHYLWLQLRRDLSLGKLTSSMNNLILLMACVLQYELGDYEQELANRNVHKLNILPNQDLIEEQAIDVWRQKFKRFRQSQVQLQFLRAAIILETYGFDYYAARDHQRQRAYLLGFNYAGIKTIRKGLIIHHFRWHNLQKVTHERRMIIFHIVQTENSKRKQVLGFKCPSNEECQTLYLRLMEQKYFFTEFAFFEKRNSSTPSHRSDDWRYDSIHDNAATTTRTASSGNGQYTTRSNRSDVGRAMSVEFTKGALSGGSTRVDNFDSDQLSDSVDFDYLRSELASPPVNITPVVCADRDCLECLNQARLCTQQVPGYGSARTDGDTMLDSSSYFGTSKQPPSSYRKLLTATKSNSLDQEVDLGRTSKRVGFTQEQGVIGQIDAISGSSPDYWPTRCGPNGSCDKVLCDSQSTCDYCLHLAGKASTNSDRTVFDQENPSAIPDSNYLSTSNRLGLLQEASTMTDQVNTLGSSVDIPVHFARLTRYYRKLFAAKIKQIYQANKPVVMAMGPFFKLCIILISVNLLLRVINGLSMFLIDMLRNEQSQSQPVQTHSKSGPTKGFV